MSCNDDTQFVCGDGLFPAYHSLAELVGADTLLNCSSAVVEVLYAATQAVRSRLSLSLTVCARCDAAELSDDMMVEQRYVGPDVAAGRCLPLCQACQEVLNCACL